MKSLLGWVAGRLERIWPIFVVLLIVCDRPPLFVLLYYRMAAMPPSSPADISRPHPPVQCHVQVNVYPVCPHDPPNLLDVNQQLKFVKVIRPAVQTGGVLISMSGGEHSICRTAMMNPLTRDTSMAYSLPSPLVASTPRGDNQRSILRQLLTEPAWGYLKDVEPVTPPISPIKDNNFSTATMHDLGPILPSLWENGYQEDWTNAR